MPTPIFGLSLLGFIPALLAIYYTLRDYYEFIEDRKIFIALIFAGVLGLIAALFHLLVITIYIYSWSYITYGFTILIVVLIEILMKFVVLNHRHFGAKFDTTFYGTVFGFIFGALIIVGQLYRHLHFNSIVSIGIIIALLFYIVAVTLIHGVIGTIIGYCCAYPEYRLRYLSYAFLLQLPFYAILFFWYMFFVQFGAIGTAGCEYTIILCLVAYASYHYVRRTLLFQTLPANLRRKLRRRLRRNKLG